MILTYYFSPLSYYLELAPSDERAVYKEMIIRDKRRWKQADLNKDSFLSKDEFIHFLHPEEAEHMREIVVMVTYIYSLCVHVLCGFGFCEHILEGILCL